MVIPSTILEGKLEYKRQMNEWLAAQNFQWRLCYRASSNGWEATDFHSKCDNQGPTVVIVQVGNYIFGGFTDCNWSPSRMNGTYENCTRCISIVRMVQRNPCQQEANLTI